MANESDVVLAIALRLGDVVRLFDGAYGDATVHRIDDAGVHLKRPYMHTDDFSYTGGVLAYIGVEDIDLPLASSHAFTRVVRGAALR